jgi:hypothetical protein
LTLAKKVLYISDIFYVFEMITSMDWADKRRISGQQLEVMSQHHIFGETIKNLSTQIDVFLQLSQAWITTAELPQEIIDFRRVLTEDISPSEMAGIRFKCEDIATLVMIVQKALETIPPSEVKAKIERIVIEIQQSVSFISVEGSFDRDISLRFKSEMSFQQIQELLMWAKNRVLSESTLKSIFRSIISMDSIEQTESLLDTFFSIISAENRLSNPRMIVFYASIIAGIDVQASAWKDERMEIFLWNRKVSQAILESPDPEMKNKLEKVIKTKILKRLYAKNIWNAA